MRIAFIGASHWHLPLYLDPALEIPGVTVVGVSDPDPTVTAALAARLGCTGDPDYRELCRRVKPDFVFALGRHVDMPDEARFLIREGIPFALEKPCGLTAADVASVAAEAATAGAFAAVPLVMRNGEYLPLLAEEAARGGAQYATFRFMAGFPARYTAAGCGWMLDPALAGGGATINLGIHFFDLALQLLGPDVAIGQATMSNAAWGHPVEDYAAVTFRRGGQVLLMETGYIFPGPTSTFDMHFVMRTPNRYMVAPDQQSVDVFELDGRVERRRMGTTNVPCYPLFVRDVLERARAGRAPAADLADMVPILKLVEAAYDAAGWHGGRAPAA
jgi:predicted dehydrogenase